MTAVRSTETSTRHPGGYVRSVPRWLVLALALVGWSGPVEAATFVVDSTGDQVAVAPTNDGICDADPTAGVFCTLRAAIQEANGSAGPDIIHFNILPAGAKTIVLGSFLPNITSVVTIDGTTQPGFVAAPPFAPVIELNAAAASSPLNLRGGSSGSTIRGLCINRAPGSAIRILESSNNVIVGNFIGTDLTGTAALGNRVGIYIGGTGVAANGNRIGGVAPPDRNIISGNTPDDGIQINAGTGGAADNIVEGNYIGVDVSGTLPLGNATQGVALFTSNSNSDNVVGGTAPNAGNVISANGNDGVLIADAGTTGTLVQGNRIGTNAAGTAAIPNFRGIEITNSSSSNTVGGPPGSQNLISGNTAQGILITTAGTTNNTVTRALIGTNAAGNAKIPNGVHGVEINNGASNNTIGGAIGTGNVISGNGFSGVNIIGAATSGNIILGNIIGLDQAGAAILSNTQFGLAIAQGSNANIVGNATGRNVISGNDMGGVRIVDIATDNNLVQSNYIGLDVTGMLARPNVANGVILDTGGVATGNRIGSVGLGNVISGNGSAGVRILNGMTGTLVVDNIIGRNANNTASVPNGAGGVRIQASSGNTIGGTGTRDGNIIAGNTGDGVAVVGVATGNAILGNRTFSNIGLGVDLLDDAVTVNDGAKSAGQPNLLMDFPVFTAATQTGNLLDVTGYVGSAPGQALFANARVEVFKSDNEVSGFGEGEILLGVVTSDASGNFSGTFDITGKGMVPGDQITGTATDTSNNTSELAANFGPAVTIAYSVGTDNTALYSDTASASAGTLTLNSAAANNIGVGDEIRRGANRYYIVERNSATEFTIQDSAANGGTPGDTNISFASTAITIFRAFNSLSAAEASSLDANHLATANLVAGNFQLSWPCYNDAAMNDMVSVGSYTTGPSNYIRIFTPTSASEVGTSQRHTGTAGTGFRLAPMASGSSYQIIELNTGYIRVEGVEIDGAGLTNALFVRGIRIPDGLSNVGDIRIDSCVIHDLHTTQNGFAIEGSMGIIDFQSADFQGPPMRVSNNIIYDITNIVNVGHIAGIHIGSRATSYVYNNTVHSIINTGNACAPNCGPAWGIYSKAFGGGAVSVIATNNVCGSVSAVNPVQRCYDTQSGAGLTQTTNVSSDATGTAGLINQTAYATYFVDVTPMNEDLHIVDSSLNLWGANGTDLSGDPNLPVTDDVDGQGRARPDIGADENVATRLYRSVGITATALESGTTNALTIVGFTATFASPLADNIDQHRHQVGDDRHRDREALLGTLDKGLIERLATARRQGDETDHHAEDQEIRHHRRLALQNLPLQTGEIDHHAADQRRHAAEVGQHHRIPQLEPLDQGGDHQPHQGADKGGDQQRDEDIRGIGGPHLRTVDKDGDRDQGDRRGVDHQEEDLIVAGGLRIRIQALQLLHRLQTQRRRRVVEAQHVGGHVHDDRTGRRDDPAGMPGNSRRKQRTKCPRQQVDGASLLSRASSSRAIDT